jgi:hypothetical protein
MNDKKQHPPSVKVEKVQRVPPAALTSVRLTCKCGLVMEMTTAQFVSPPPTPASSGPLSSESVFAFCPVCHDDRKLKSAG